jgi:hypothetical protein
MRFRFLFVDDRGEEVYVSSPEELARHARSGALREEALLYDALTREWAPARSHPAFARLVEHDGHSAPDGGPESASRSSTPVPHGGAPTPDTDTGALPTLEPLPEDEVQVDTVQLFLEDRERERREDLREHDRELKTAAFLDAGVGPETRRHAPISGSWGDTPPAPGDAGYDSFLAAQRRWGESLPPRGGAGATGGDGSRSAGNPPARSGPLARWVRRTRARSRQRSRERAGAQMALLTLLLGVGAWGIADAWGVTPLQATSVPREEPTPVEPPPPDPSMEAAKSEAFGYMVRGMEALRSELGLGEPPVTWMGGPYLSNALAFPEVEAYWLRYLEYVEALRSREEDLFRTGFVTQLQGRGIDGAAVSIRLAEALQDFELDRGRREAVYAGMEELARAALDLHGFLLENMQRIRYAPVDQGVNDDPILEAVPDDPVTEAGLWSRIDRLVEALDGVADPDPRRRRDVSRSVLGSLALPPPPPPGDPVRR